MNMEKNNMKKYAIAFALVTSLFVTGPVFATGAVTGSAKFTGKAPTNKPIKMDADPVCKAAHTTPVTTEKIVTDDQGNLANVFVYVKSGLSGTYEKPAESVVLDQKSCLYHPMVLGLQVGQNLQIVNSDPTLHNVHCIAKNNPQFNIGMPIKGMKTDKTFNKPEVLVKFKCDVHPWMFAYVGVVDNPFYAVTGADGSFSIKDLPAGKYTLEAVHPYLGKKSMDVEVKDGDDSKASFTFKPKAKKKKAAGAASSAAKKKSH